MSVTARVYRYCECPDVLTFCIFPSSESYLLLHCLKCLSFYYTSGVIEFREQTTFNETNPNRAKWSFEKPTLEKICKISSRHCLFFSRSRKKAVLFALTMFPWLFHCNSIQLCNKIIFINGKNGCFISV